MVVTTYKARRIVRGKVVADAIVLRRSFSFLGDVDMGNATVLLEDDPTVGKSIAGKVLIYKETKGSSGGMMVLMTLKEKGIAPAAIVTEGPVDYNMAEAAILTKIPFMCEPEGDLLNEVRTGDRVTVDADRLSIEVGG